MKISAAGCRCGERVIILSTVQPPVEFIETDQEYQIYLDKYSDNDRGV
jgi:hypothetical protein